MVDTNYFSEDSNKPDDIIKLNKLCDFIDKLSTLAHYHDSRNSDDDYKLVFIKNNENGKSISAILNIILTKDLIDIEDFDYSILDFFSDPSSKTLLITMKKLAFSEIQLWNLFVKIKYRFKT